MSPRMVPGKTSLTCFNEGRHAHAAESLSLGSPVTTPPVVARRFNEGRHAHAAE